MHVQIRRWLQVSLLVLLAFGAPKWVQASVDSLQHPSLVFIEGFDTEGKRLSLGTGVIVKKGFVATNYHYVTGMASVMVYKQGETKKYPSNGYLSVEESKDLIVLSVPGIVGKVANMNIGAFPEEGKQIQIIPTLDALNYKTVTAEVMGSKEIMNMSLPQVITQKTRDCTGGPAFMDGKLVGFVTAGYLDDRYYAYVMPVAELRRILNRSFIIKALNSLSDEKPIGTSYYQKSLIESLTSVLWLSMENAERLARKKGRMVIIDVYANWSGWSKLMEKNTYSRKRVIRYINENYYAVRLNAESTDTIVFNRQAYFGAEQTRYHTLAYSLLEGQMDFPSTVILDEQMTVLMVIPGYMDAAKMEVVLYYFHEKAYLNERKTFQEYETEFYQRKNRF